MCYDGVAQASYRYRLSHIDCFVYYDMSWKNAIYLFSVISTN